MPTLLLVWEGPLDTLTGDIESAQQALKKFDIGWTGQVSYVLSVLITVVSAFVAGRFRTYCYVWHFSVYALYVLPNQILDKSRKGQLCVFFELTWVFSVLSCVYLALLIFGVELVTSARLFASFRCFAFGPVGLAAVFFGDALVFHDRAMFAALSIRLMPLFTAWCVWANEVPLLDSTWGATFTAEEIQAIPGTQVFLDSLAAYSCWLTLNTVWMLCIVCRGREAEWATVYSDTMLLAHPHRRTITQKMLGHIGDGRSEVCRLLKYQLAHAVVHVGALLLAVWLLQWWQIALFMLVTTFLSAAFRGAQWYAAVLRRISRVVRTLKYEDQDPALGHYGTML
eukprot:TRINITY_DN48249_c0_g1_i1.p1 TRINITY_DN48249_c0_g1~~TRINITY_DN48249_c0_g1_i1.p1  ORF type:complete len:340 (+),score=94.61 TRINITY_DN48249_c0_g1_i1:62-1081(+)